MSEATESTVKNNERSLANLKSFKKGQSGNPAGRPAGSRNKLSDRFLQETYKVFQKQGTKALERMCEEEPSKFCTMVSGILPKDYQVSVMNESTQFVISSQPVANELEWKERHGIDQQVIDSTAEVVEE